MPHGRHIYAKASDMENAKICAYPQSDHEIPHCKFVLRCCADCPCINITDQETDNQYSKTTLSIRFHIYHIIARCTDHGRIPLKYKRICHMYKQESSSDESTKIYTRKESVMTETKIYDFNNSLYIPDIQKLAFHLPHVHILGKNCRNLLEVDSILNRIYRGTNIISCPMQSGNTEPNSKYYLEKYFSIEWSKHPNFI